MTLLVVVACGPALAGWQPDVTDERQVQAHNMLEQISRKEGSELQALMDQTYAFAVFPDVSHTGLILGWASGYGVLIENDHFIGYVRQRRLSMGFQFGRQSQGQLLLFRDREAVEAFKQEQLEFTPQASVHATKPRSVAEASFMPRVAVFSLTQDGLMLEAAVGATRFRFFPLDPQSDQD